MRILLVFDVDVESLMMSDCHILSCSIIQWSTGYILLAALYMQMI